MHFYFFSLRWHYAVCVVRRDHITGYPINFEINWFVPLLLPMLFLCAVFVLSLRDFLLFLWLSLFSILVCTPFVMAKCQSEYIGTNEKKIELEERANTPDWFYERNERKNHTKPTKEKQEQFKALVRERRREKERVSAGERQRQRQRRKKTGVSKT